jgi:hypothetical protein
MNDLEAFAGLTQALAPWRTQLVFIGGWAHRLHRFDSRANKPAHQPVFTRDTDLAFAAKTPFEGDIKDALDKRGFKEILMGELSPPVAHYTLGDANRGFYAEFLTPLRGSGTKRSGKPDATIATAGITAQKIRHLDILLVSPWAIKVGPEHGIPLPEPMDIQVAHPLCFMVQKFLIQKYRDPKKRSQDLLYVYDTIDLFGPLLSEFNNEWARVIKPALGKLSDDVLQTCEETFSSVTDIIREAALIPQDRRLQAEQMQQTCKYAFDQILR